MSARHIALFALVASISGSPLSALAQSQFWSPIACAESFVDLPPSSRCFSATSKVALEPGHAYLPRARRQVGNHPNLSVETTVAAEVGNGLRLDRLSLSQDDLTVEALIGFPTDPAVTIAAYDERHALTGFQHMTATVRREGRDWSYPQSNATTTTAMFTLGKRNCAAFDVVGPLRSNGYTWFMRGYVCAAEGAAATAELVTATLRSLRVGMRSGNRNAQGGTAVAFVPPATALASATQPEQPKPSPEPQTRSPDAQKPAAPPPRRAAAVAPPPSKTERRPPVNSAAPPPVKPAPPSPPSEVVPTPAPSPPPATAAGPSTSPPPLTGKLSSAGSGFFVSSIGHVVTNDHVVRTCLSVLVKHGGVGRPARLIRRGNDIDLALLETDYRPARVATVRENGNPRRGEAAIAVGYPLPSALSSEPIVTIGTVSALAGLRGDRRMFQVTTPIQPGNSGGPLLDGSGHVAGVVTSSINDIEVLRRTGAVPQNINFAVRGTEVRDFLEDARIDFLVARSDQRLEADVIGEMGASFVVAIECYR